MSFGPLSELERNACLIEDVVADSLDVWTHVKEVEITPRSLARLMGTLTRLHDASDHLTKLRVEMHNLIREAKRA